MVLQEWIRGGNNLWEKDRQRVAKCFSIARELSVLALENKFSAFPELCGYAYGIKLDNFYKQLKELLVEKLLENPIANSFILDILFFYSGETPVNLQVILEVANNNHEFPANHLEVQKAVNNTLFAKKGNLLAAKSQEKKSDAFGAFFDGGKGKFPETTIPVLGKVKLRAMNQESLCQTRYRMIDAASFPAADKTRQRMKNALEWISDKSLEGKTWTKLSSTTGRQTILFAYPVDAPEISAEIAGLLGGNESQDGKEVLFSKIAGEVVKALNGVVTNKPDAEIEVFVLCKPDGRRTKVEVSKRYKAKTILASAEMWQKGAGNIPSIKIKGFPQKKGEQFPSVEPLTPYPGEVVWCLNTSWQRGGTEAVPVHGFSVADGLGLLLDVNPDWLLRRMFGAVLKNSVPVLLGLGAEQNKNKVFLASKKYQKQVYLIPCILGLLLHKSGVKGGDMQSAAYLVGRLLSSVDKLNYKYSEIVRGEKSPTQLLGNSLMGVALENPIQALALLSERLMPYQAWATGYSKEDVGLVKYFLKQCGEISASLSKLQLPENCTDADKAQMLLGYLAAEDAKEKVEDPAVSV
ncbi:MAG TPA: hypothetical protein DCL44_06940 [Elusimicrobia bacterium]|nr:hypothetical protein [Elusimicrobiota bacterium]